MIRLKQTLLLWRLKAAHGLERLRQQDSSDIDVRAILRRQQSHPLWHTVNLLLFYAWQMGLRQWSLTEQGPSWGLAAMRDYDRKRLAGHIDVARKDDPLSTDADHPPELSVSAVAEWLDSTADRPAGEWTDAFRFIRKMSRNYVAADDQRAVERAFPQKWPSVRVRLWEMCKPDDGCSSWRLFSSDGTSRGSIEQTIQGQPITINLTFMHEKIDIQMVAASGDAGSEGGNCENEKD